MKFTTLPRTLVLAAALCGNAFALTPITENFDGPKLDPERWFTSVLGKAKFKQSDGKLNLLVSRKPAQLNLTSIELTNSYPYYGETDWQFTLDLSNTANAGNKAACGFMILNVADRKDYLWVEFYGKGGIAGGVLVNGKPAKAGSFKTVGVPRGSIKVAYNKTTNLITFFASLTGSGEDASWKKIGRFSPTGSGGDVRGNWKMKFGSQFGIQLFGLSRGITVASGKVSLDNFVLSAPN